MNTTFYLNAQDGDVGSKVNLNLVNLNLIKILYTVSRLKIYCLLLPPSVIIINIDLHQAIISFTSSGSFVQFSFHE